VYPYTYIYIYICISIIIYNSEREKKREKGSAGERVREGKRKERRILLNSGATTSVDFRFFFLVTIVFSKERNSGRRLREGERVRGRVGERMRESERVRGMELAVEGMIGEGEGDGDGDGEGEGDGS